jgi:plastocyanin
MHFARTAATLLAVAALVAACSNSTGSNPGGHTTALTVTNNAFNPTPDTVPAGQVTFTWVNASNSHNVTWLTGPGTLPANSSTMTSGSYQATLAQGTYTYHCTIHSGMNGTIVVQ